MSKTDVEQFKDRLLSAVWWAGKETPLTISEMVKTLHSVEDKVLFELKR